MFLSLVVAVNLSRAEIVVDHPNLAFKAPVVIGRRGHETPTGIYLAEKAYSSRLKMPLLILRRDDDGIVAIHPNLPSREQALKSKKVMDRELSEGCIGLDEKRFTELFKYSNSIVVQVY